MRCRKKRGLLRYRPRGLQRRARGVEGFVDSGTMDEVRRGRRRNAVYVEMNVSSRGSGPRGHLGEQDEIGCAEAIGAAETLPEAADATGMKVVRMAQRVQRVHRAMTRNKLKKT
jgi:hypothetical protein